MFILQCKVLSVHGLFSIMCSVYSVQCTEFNKQFAVCSFNRKESTVLMDLVWPIIKHLKIKGGVTIFNILTISSVGLKNSGKM